MTVPTPCAPTSLRAMAEPRAAALAHTLKALADPLRVRILSAISVDPRGEACVCDFEQLADVSQPTISHHLKVLRDAGVLLSERRKTWVYYRIAPAIRPAVMMLLDSFAPADTQEQRADATPLTNIDAHLTRLAAELHVSHPALDEQLVLHVVRGSYTSLARTTTSSSTLASRTEQFARQRLEDLSRDRTAPPRQVLFVCVANAGRSQLAAALVNHRSGGRVVAHSAGSRPAAAVHPHVRTLVESIDPAGAKNTFPKPLTDEAVRAADVVVTMGCGDVCPVISGGRYEDWALGDPALASPEGVAAIHDDIASRVDILLASL